MIRLPSLRFIVEKARATFLRFPYVLLCSIICAVLSIILIENESEDFWFTKLFMTFGLGIPLFFSLTLYLEKPLPALKPSSLALLSGGSLLLAGFYFLSGQAPTENFFLNYTQWALALHLLAAFSPFLSRGEARGFWQFNRYLFLRFCLSTLYAGVFYVGLVIALGAVDHLLGIKIHDKLYFDLWVFSAFVLQCWHFLAGVPGNLRELEKDNSYPGGLKIFTQYLLIPLVTLYLAILYLYLFKILIQWNWPKGTVTWLVSVVSVFGVFNLLLLQPVQEKKENAWIRIYAKGFYLALLPLLAMLFIAVGKRIAQYGVTEQRYFVAALGVWILGIALYFLLRKAPSIKTVPMTLFLITLLTSLGPWGAYSVSGQSQLGRLKGFLVKDGLWNGTTAVKATREIPLEDRKEMSSILDYLVENHGVAPLQGWFDLDLSKWKDERERSRYGYSSVSGAICKSLGFDYVSGWNGGDTGQYFSYSTDQGNSALLVNGYDILLPNVGTKNYTLEGKAYFLEQVGDKLILKAPGEADLTFDLEALLKSVEASPEAKKSESLPQALLTLDSSNDKFQGRLCLQSLTGYKKETASQFTYLQGFLLLKRK